MLEYDVEFQFHDLDIWFRVNDVEASSEEEAYVKGAIKLKETVGIDVEEVARTHKVDYWKEIAYLHESNWDTL